MSAIYVNDPANGESVSLSELGRRYGLSAGEMVNHFSRAPPRLNPPEYEDSPLLCSRAGVRPGAQSPG